MANVWRIIATVAKDIPYGRGVIKKGSKAKVLFQGGGAVAVMVEGPTGSKSAKVRLCRTDLCGFRSEEFDIPEKEYNACFRGDIIDHHHAFSEAQAQEQLNRVLRIRYFMDDTDAWEKGQLEGSL